jgi:5-methylcytosine-specific restriction endonuclease McrA
MSFESDHVIPIALGGHNRGELAPMHKACNRKRGIRDLETVRVDVHSRRHY